MEQNTIQAYIAVFGTPQGETVLRDLRRHAERHVQVDRHPTEHYPNAAFMNPTAAVYRTALVDFVRRIEGILSKRES